jgi:two-component system chemotaxis sensor kinase CheA
MSADIMARLREAFRTEAMELLAELGAALLALEAQPGASEYVHRVFRAIHTIKGSGSTAGIRHLAEVAHKLEEAFDLARDGKLAITRDLVDCGLKACDILQQILNAADPDAECSGEREVGAALQRLVSSESASSRVAAPVSQPPETSRKAYEVTVRPHRGLFYSCADPGADPGADPVTLLDELRGLGEAHIACHTEAVPLFSDLDAESCYLHWDVKLVTSRGESAIREVFRFVEDECDVAVRLLEDQASSVALLGSVPAESLELFADECREHLESIESQALQLEAGPHERGCLDALFRSVHSIKGNAGVLLGQLPGGVLPPSHPLPLLARMAHALESTLDPHREPGAPPLPRDTVSLVLESRDAMRSLLDTLTGRADCLLPAAALLERLRIETGKPAGVLVPPNDSAFQNTAGQCLAMLETCLQRLEKGESGAALFKTYQRGLKTLASAAAYQKRTDLDEPLATQLRIAEYAMRASDPLHADDLELLANSLQSMSALAAGNPVAAAKPLPGGAPRAANKAANKAAAPSGTVRIDQEKLERLMRVVGELLVARGAIPTLAEKLAAGGDRATIARALKDAGGGISRIAEELQASVMAIRMMPVKTVFQRFPRLVRDLARSLGKEVQLVVEGDSVELDKTILEQIGDPLVHLVRNGVDHGIERPEDRVRAGKNPAGRLTLRAANEAGNVVIQIEDDGKGLNAEALKRKAVEKGLIAEEAAAAMTAAEACQLVFLPGLSTAEKVTDVSGRGVGMDVVRNNILGLQGTVEIRSNPGTGTVFTIKLPTSLIVSKGILLEAGGQEYILPLNSLRDMVKVPRAAMHTYQGCRITQVRGEAYAVFSLAEMFGLPAPPMEEIPVAIVETGSARYGLIADRFVSEVEVLVKPLAGGLENCREFHGAAIMGDGRVVLVLNPQECRGSGGR